MECIWVEYDLIGNTKYCPFAEDFEKYERDEMMFREDFCAFCLEGQKIEALNEIARLLERIVEDLRK